MSSWNDDPPVPRESWDSDPAVRDGDEPSVASRVGRQLGLTARAGMQGAMVLPNMLADAVASIVNLGARGVNAATGGALERRTLTGQITGENPVWQMRRPSQNVENFINAVTPTPETPTERVVGRIGSDAVSLMTGMGAANAARGLGPVAARVADTVMTQPRTQLSGVAGLAAGGGVGRELDPDSPVGEIAGSVGGLVTGIAVPAALQLAGRGIQGLLGPFAEGGPNSNRLANWLTGGGQQRIVGNALLNMSDDPATLGQRLAANPREIVPGSLRTTAEVADDPALYQLERGVRAMGPREAGQFAIRDAQRAAARREAMTLVPPVEPSEAGTVVRAGLNAARDRTAGEVSRLYQTVPNNAGEFSGTALYERVMPRILELYGRTTEGTPAALRPIINRLTNAGTMTYGDLRAMAREMGDVAGRAQMTGDRTLAGAAGGIRSIIEGFVDETVGAASGLTAEQAAAHRVANVARSNMGAVYDDPNTAVGRVLDTNQFGRPTMPAERIPATLTAGPTAIRQLEAAIGNNPQALGALRGAFINDLRNAVQTTTPDAQGAFVDSAARFHNFVNDNRDAIRVLFGPEGMRRLETIARDFTSRQMVDSVGRAVGSNTVQNLSTAHVIGAAFGGLINPRSVETNPLFQPLRLMYRWSGSERALQEMLAQAMLDPFFASTLTQRATPQTVQRAVSMLNRSFGQRLGQAALETAQPAVPALALASPRRTEARQ